MKKLTPTQKNIYEPLTRPFTMIRALPLKNKYYKQMKKTVLLLLLIPIICWSQTEKKITKRGISPSSGVLYNIVNQNEQNDATWLQWPHQYQYGAIYCKRLDNIWVEVTGALSSNEKVNIIAYDENEKSKISNLLKVANVSMANVSFKIMQTDDFWIGDSGPIFARDKNGLLLAQDYGFNGWGKRQKFINCDQIPSKIANDQNIALLDLNASLTFEGTAIQSNGNGTIIATKSSILNNNRNLGKTQLQIEQTFKKNLGVSNFIWLKGTSNADNTDFHIDSFLRIANDSLIVTMEDEDLREWKVPDSDIDIINNANTEIGRPFTYIKLPLSSKPVITAYGKNLGYRGSYLNYHVTNTLVFVPNFVDSNDVVANEIIQKIYPDKKVVGIDIRNLYTNGASLSNILKNQPKKVLEELSK